MFCISCAHWYSISQTSSQSCWVITSGGGDWGGEQYFDLGREGEGIGTPRIGVEGGEGGRTVGASCCLLMI